MATIRIPTPLRKLTQGKEEVTASGGTIGALIAGLEAQYPGIKERICDDNGQVRRFVNIFANDEDIRFLQNLDTPVKDTRRDLDRAGDRGRTLSLSMQPGVAQRYLRQIALPEIGPDGQQRINDATVAIAAEGDDLAAEIAARYLAAAGVGPGAADRRRRCRRAGVRGRLARVEPRRRRRRAGLARRRRAWLAALDGADLVVRAGFDDDPMLRATVRLGIPAVLLRALDDRVELLAVREQGPCPHVDLAIPPRRAEGASAGATAVVAATLGASEALWLLVRRDEARRPDARPRRKNAPARHLSLPLSPDGGAPRVQEIPWTPECFACGGGSVEMILS